MRKYSHTLTFPLLALSFALLFSLFLLAGCGTDADSSTQATPTTGNTVVDDTTKSDMGTSATATPNAPGGFDCASVNHIPSAECQALVALYESTNGPNWVDNNGWLVSNTPCTWSGISCTEGHVSHINLLYNQLTGVLPPELGNLSHLRVLALWVNQLYGPIPAELGNLSELISLELSVNQLMGPVPTELGDLTKLQTLSLTHNQFSGPLPSTLDNLVSLELLDLSYNQFSGTIPSELGNLTNLSILYLSHNELSGEIPVALGNLSGLNELDLSYNQLHGAVPEFITLIPQRTLWGNQLDGTITRKGQEPIVVDYEGVRFNVDPALATSIWPEVIPARPIQEGEPFWYASPEHIRFTFANPHMLPRRSRMGINLAAEAQILVYPLAKLVEIEPWGPSRIEALQSLLVEKGPIPDGELPLLPVINAAQMFHTQAQYLEFGNIQGIRFISQHTQEARPIMLSQEIFYTFQGFTDDNAYYVAAFFPLTTAILPDKIEVDDWDAFHTNYDNYLSETTADLDQLSPGEFTPDIKLLDAVIASLRLEPGSILSKSLLVMRPTLYTQGYYHEKD